MNRTFSIVSAALIAIGLAAAAWSADKKDADLLKQAELDWSAATVRHDPAVVQRLLADDYAGIDGRGIMSTKADEILEATEQAADGSLVTRVLAEEIRDITVRIYNDVGIVNGRTVQQTERAGVKAEVQFRRTTVWVKRKGLWQCVAFHGSRLLNPPTK